MINGKVCPPCLHLFVELGISSCVWIPKIIQLAGMFDKGSWIVIGLFTKYKSVHRLGRARGWNEWDLLMDRAGVHRGGVCIISSHESGTIVSLCLVVIAVEVDFSFFSKAVAPEASPPFLII